jgi:hypothetical protein
MALEERIKLAVDADSRAALVKLSNRTGTSVAHHVRLAIHDYLKKQGRRRK